MKSVLQMSCHHSVCTVESFMQFFHFICVLVMVCLYTDGRCFGCGPQFVNSLVQVLPLYSWQMCIRSKSCASTSPDKLGNPSTAKSIHCEIHQQHPILSPPPCCSISCYFLLPATATNNPELRPGSGFVSSGGS